MNRKSRTLLGGLFLPLALAVDAARQTAVRRLAEQNPNLDIDGPIPMPDAEEAPELAEEPGPMERLVNETMLRNVFGSREAAEDFRSDFIDQRIRAELPELVRNGHITAEKALAVTNRLDQRVGERWARKLAREGKR